MENYVFEKTSIEIIREMIGKLPEINIDKGLATCVDDEDFYIELFTDFVNLDIKEQLVRFMDAEDHDNYCIRIHGFKNNAYSVGATVLGDISYEMEKISREALTEELKKLQTTLFEQFDRICLVFNQIVQG
ncbi:MAG: hypothetical protein IKK53_06895 [Ruminiclostridium sp.]|nr:hypothetical protein [Ruminiclostridium sp.]